jgi:hypothetical protein
MITVILTLLFSALFPLSPALAERPVPAREGRYSLQLGTTYFSTKANYQSGGGTSTALPTDWKFQNTQIYTQVDFDWSKVFRSYAGFSYALSESTGSNFGTPELSIPRSNAGINELWLGSQAWFHFGRYSLVPQVDLTFPMLRLDLNDKYPALGEGALRFRGSSWLVARFGAWQPFAYLGAEYRDGGRSALLPYSAGVNFRPGKWWIQTEYRGFAGLTDDKDTSDPTARNSRIIYSKINGGSARFWAVNPAVSEVALETGLRFSGFNASLGYAQTINGSNFSDGFTVLLALAYTGRLQSSSAAAATSDPAPVPTTPNNSTFEITPEEFDESVFKEDDQTQTTVRKKVRQTPSAEKSLDETQKELEKLK